MIVEATNRRWARVKIFETIIRRMEEALRKRGVPLPETPHVAVDLADATEYDDDLPGESSLQAELEVQPSTSHVGG
jgi:hypothetical protein